MPLTATATTANPCGCCGGTPPPPFECGCALFIGGNPDTNSYQTQGDAYDHPAPDYATAQDLIANYTAGCIGFFPGNLAGNPPINSISASFDRPTEIISSSESVGPAPNTSLAISTAVNFSVALKAGALVSADFNCVSVGSSTIISTVILVVLKCDESEVIEQVELDTSDFGFAATQAGTITTSIAIPSDGEYFIILIALAGPATSGDTITSLASDYEVGSDDDLWVNPIIAIWNDSGTRTQLWACPKLLLPPLTEFTGDWYADCAAAAAVLTDPLQVSNCVGFCGGAPGKTSFTATDGGTSLTLAVGDASGASTWGGLNLVAGQTITVACTPGGADLTVKIYDDTGTLVEDSGLTTTPFVSGALPYTGRYTVNVVVSGVGAVSTSATITSSGALSVNPIQARYDLGLDCPTTLNCGDACP